MTTRDLLLTLAASVMPLCAQQPAIPVPPAAQVFSALTAPVALPPAATPEQRAQVFNALALLPQNVSAFAVLTNVGGNLLSLAESARLPSFDAADIPAELLAVDNIALASTAASPASYALLQQVLINFSTVDTSLQLAQDWAADAREPLGDAIIESLVMHADAASALPEGAAEGVCLPASYVIITSKPGEEAVLQELNKLFLDDFRHNTPPGITPVDDTNGFSGIRMDIVETYRHELEELTRGMAPRRREQMLNELAKHPLFILSRQQGNALVIALCEDVQQLQLAATPADSLLATDKLTACDAHLAQSMIAASHVSPELANVYQAANTQPTFLLANGVAAVFTKLGELEPADKAAYDKAAAAIGCLSTELQKFTRPITQPTTLQIWYDGHLNLSLTGDAQGCSYIPGQLRLAALADTPSTSFYAETTPMQLGFTPPDGQALIDAVLNLAEGVSLTMKEDNREQTKAAFSALKELMPELRMLAAAGGTMSCGLDGQFALVMDSAYGELPKVSATTPGFTEAEVPRFSFFAGVKDRSQIGSGWETMLTAVGQITGKFGAAPGVASTLPITSQQLGSAMSYSLTLPSFTPDIIPGLTISDTGLALGTSAQLNAQVVATATGNTPFSGTVFALKFAPLGRTLRSLATALDPSAEEAVSVASSGVKPGDELLVNVAMVGGENGPTSVFVSGMRSEVQEAADNLNAAATFFEFAGTLAEGVYGAATIENGLHTLKVQILMK